MLGRELIWSELGANPGMKLCQARGLPGWDRLESPLGVAGLAAVPGTVCGQCPALLAGSCCVPSSGKRLSDCSNIYQLGAALELGVCVCLLFHCRLADVSSSPLRSVAVGSLL